MGLGQTTIAERPSLAGHLRGRISHMPGNGNIKRFERLNSFTSIASSCRPTSEQVNSDVRLSRSVRHTKGLSDSVYGRLAIYGIGVSYHGRTRTNWPCAPSITTFMLLTSPHTTPRVCAAVAFDSSRVSLSSLCNTDSMSFSPNNFFAYFSATSKP